MVKRGDVWLVSLDPTIGREIQKTRPCLVISPDDLNESLSTAIIAPMTTGSRPTRFRVRVAFRGRQGLILPDQTRTVARDRLIKRLGKVDTATLQDTLKVMRNMFAD